MKHTLFIITLLAVLAACQSEKLLEVERMPYTVPATEVTPAMEAEYYSGPVTSDSIPHGLEGYILYKSDQSCYMGEFRNGIPVPQLQADSFILAQSKDTTWTKTPSGVLYRVLADGKGKSPKPEDTVSFYYEGRLIDGTIFDGNYNNPTPLSAPAGNMIKGFTEILTMMSPGSEWEVIIPFHLAYGVRGSAGSIPQYAPLIFKMKLIK